MEHGRSARVHLPWRMYAAPAALVSAAEAKAGCPAGCLVVIASAGQLGTDEPVRVGGV